MKKELTILMPYYKRDEIEYALDFIVRSKIVDSVSTEVIHVDKLSIFFISLKVTIEGKRKIVIDRILSSLQADCEEAMRSRII